MESRSVVVDRGPLSLADVVAVARHDAPIIISEESLVEVRRTRSTSECRIGRAIRCNGA